MPWKNPGSLGANVGRLVKVAVATLVCASSLSLAGPLDSVPAGRWYQFPSSRMDSVAPSPAPSGDPASVIYAWGSGIYDSDRERLVVWGGGHGNYAGNEVYAFGPLTSATPRWERLTDPTVPPANNVARGSDGRPVSRHTYNLLTYLPAPHNQMMSCSVGSQHSNGYGVGAVDFYDFTINGKTGQPWSAGPTAPSNSYPYNSYCIFNPSTQSVFYQDNGSSSSRLQEFSLATRTWTSHVVYNPDSEPTPAVDTKRNLIITTGATHGVQLYDPANPKTLPIRVNSIGPKAVEDGRFPGFIYDPVNDQFVGWNGGSSLYTLKAPADVKTGTWVWSQLALNSGNTVTPTAVAGTRHAGYVTGTYGRFRYVPSQQGVVLVNAADESVYFFKLPGGSPAPLPSITLAASPTSIAAQGTSTLTWSSTNAASCAASGAWSGTKSTSGSEARGPLSSNSTFVLSCDNGSGGTASQSVTVSVAAAAPPPLVDLNANPTSVQAGGPTSLSWTAANASSCTASAGWSGGKATSGSENIAAVNQQTLYTLSCSGPGGTHADSVTVNVTAPVPAPVVTLTSSAASVSSGSNVTLNWNASNATGCTATGSWSGNKAVSGSQSVGPLTVISNFGLTCSGSGGSTTNSVSVSVVAQPDPTPTPTGPLSSIPASRWYQFANSRMDSVAPSPAPAGEFASIIYAWGSGIYDTDRERLVIWGGGHNNYAGNEVYAFGPLTSATPRWERLTEPTTPPANNVVRGSDGRPVSRHTYNLLTYLPAPHNKMMSCAVGSQFSNGYGVGAVDFYDFTINGKTGQPWSAGPTAPSNSYPYNSYCIFNPSTQSVFYQDNGSGNARLQEYKLATQSWTSHGLYNPGSEPTPAVDTKRNLIVTTGQYHGVQIYDPANPKTLPIRVSTTGPKLIEGGRFPGFIYDPVNDQFVGWNGGAALYALKAPADVKTGTWVWSQLALDSGNTVIPTAVSGTRQAGYVTGTYGRVRYVPSQHGVVVVNATDESVYFFKLAGGTPAPLPAITLSASPTSVAAQGTSTLTWSSTNAASCAASGAWSGTKATAGSEARGPLTANSTFTLTCNNGSGGTANKSVTVNVAAPVPAPTVDLAANPVTIPVGGSTTLAWTTANATSCTASGGWSGTKSISGSQTLTGVNQQTTYTLTCSGPGGQSADSVVVNMAAPAPVLTLTPSGPISALAGSNITLNWSATNATSCTAAGNWTGSKPVSGTQTVGPLTTNSTFSLTCTGSGGSIEANTAVTVLQLPTMTLSASPTTIAPGESTTVTWSSTNATYCVASGAWSGDKNPSGTQSVALSQSGTLTLTCKNAVAQVAQDAAITIEEPPAPSTNVATLNLISQTTAPQSNVPFTFGHVFKVGAVPSGTSLSARLADGSSVALQVDPKATHPDGSLRHAVLSGRLNSLAPNANQALTLITGTSASGTPVALSTVLSSTYDTSVSLNVGGTAYTASARAALTGTNLKSWLSGPMVSEWLAGIPFKTAAGTAHPHLMAYFHVRAYAGLTQIRTDVVIENNWSFVANPGNFAYAATVSVPGKADYVKSLTHYGKSRWHKRFWWGTQPQVYAKLDKSYLQDSKAIPKYENLQPTEGLLSSVRRSTEPMSNGDQEYNMDDTGYQAGIGPLPKWDAVYALSTDVRAFDYMLANADGGSAYSTHFRDEKTGLPISIDNYPNTSLADSNNSTPALPSGGTAPHFEGSWASHQPSIGYLPYLVTGDYFYLEETQFWSAWNLIWTNKVNRNGNKGWWYTGSIRGQAWAYRSLAQAAYITPDTHPFKAYLLDKLNSNLARDVSLYVSPGGPHKNNLGAMNSYNGNEAYLFFDYFMSWAVQYMVDLGFTNAVPLRDYKVKFPIGIMGNGTNQYCFQGAALYIWKVGTGNQTFYPDFKTMFENTFPGVAGIACGTPEMSTFLKNKTGQSVSGANGMLGDQTSTTYYFANLQPALAAAADSGVAGGVQAWQRAQASGVHPDYRDNPIWAVVPRSLP